MKSHKPHPILS